MVGAIRKRDILAHPFITVHSFGWPLFLKALLAGRDETFLSLLAGTTTFGPPTVEVPELLGHCVQLERRAQEIYESLSERFTDQGLVKQFFDRLAQQEQEHYEMLELCRKLAGREGWLEEHFTPWLDAVPRLEQQMDGLESSLEDLDSVTDALRLVLQLEGSEINQVFRGAITATDSRFVRALRAFETAEAKHIAYIADQIPKFEPDLAAECRDLSTAHQGNTIQ
jgi:rubrerythrin